MKTKKLSKLVKQLERRTLSILDSHNTFVILTRNFEEQIEELEERVIELEKGIPELPELPDFSEIPEIPESRFVHELKVSREDLGEFHAIFKTLAAGGTVSASSIPESVMGIVHNVDLYLDRVAADKALDDELYGYDEDDADLQDNLGR
ncbi:hypothetical protein SEA_LILYPAD_68 [Gordonia phage LilyPad]|nr:hypothetical protein SEA_LILYPAD_68 [Gordonia phage LilyPad]